MESEFKKERELDCNQTGLESVNFPSDWSDEITEENVSVLIEELKVTRCSQSISCTPSQEFAFYDRDCWRYFIVCETENVENFQLEKMTQLLTRTKQLNVLDFDLLQSVSEEMKSVYKKCCMFEPYQFFIKILRNFRYSPYLC